MKANWTRWVITALLLLTTEAARAQYGAPPYGRPQMPQPAAYYQGNAPVPGGMAAPAPLPGFPTPAQGQPLGGYEPPPYDENAQSVAPPPAGYSDGGGSGYCSDEGCAPARRFPHTYGNVDYLMWWGTRSYIPVLATTSPIGTPRFVNNDPNLPNAGTLGRAGDPVFGGGNYNNGIRNGGRIDFGVWMDEEGSAAIGGRFMAVEGDRSRFSAESVGGQPGLFRPFFDANLNPPGQNALEIGFFDPVAGVVTSEGTIDIVAKQSFLAADGYMKLMMVDECDLRVDVLGGYMYTRLDDSVDIRSSSTAIQAFGQPTFNFNDVFRARNEFHGAAFGIRSESRRGRLNAVTTLRCAFGVTRQQVTVDGSGSVVVGGNAFPINTGFLATNNIEGTFVRHRNTAVPELTFTLGYWLTPHLQATVGYSAMYWTNVAQSGDIIDTQVDPIGGARPAFQWKDSEYWMQGINFGLAWDF